MNIILKNRENKTFKELAVGDVFTNETLEKAYMKVALSESLKKVYKCNEISVCLNDGYLWFMDSEEQVFKINGTFIEEVQN